MANRSTTGYGRGFGFRGSSPPWPYVGRGRGGLPRCYYPGLGTAQAGAWAPYQAPYGPAATRDQELSLLSSQAETLRSQLEQIERRIEELKKG